MDRKRLSEALDRAFAADPGEREAVVRAAGDLADDGRLVADLDAAVTADDVVAHLRDAPSGGLAERWNWWMGALELSFGGYREFAVRAWRDGEE